MWLPREVTQRLIYFTGGRPLRLLGRFFASFSATIGAPGHILPFLLARGIPSERRGVVVAREEASSRHCATYTAGQPPLHAATSYLHEKGVASSFSIPGVPPSPSTAPAIPDEAPLEAPSSVNTVHHYRRGSLYFKGHGARLFTLVPRHFGHGPPPPPPSSPPPPSPPFPPLSLPPHRGLFISIALERCRD